MEKVSSRIETPEEALERVMNMPGLTPQQIQNAKNWVNNQTRVRSAFGKDFVKRRRDHLNARSKELDDLIFSTNQAANEISDQVRKGVLTSAEGLKETRALNRHLAYYENEIAGLDSTVAVVDAVSADPAAYFHSFFGKYPSIAHQVSHIEEALYS